MGIFSKNNEVEPVEIGSTTLQKRTKSVLDLFTTTITSLTQIVTEAKDQARQRQEEIDAATVEKAKLEELAESNEEVINRIKGIVSPKKEEA